MHEQFLKYLCCPETGEDLRLEVSEKRVAGIIYTGNLISESGRLYPIIRGIPRFVNQESYTANFGFEWQHWPRVQFEDQNLGRPTAGLTTNMWQTITGVTQEDLTGQVIVDFGCGSGRFLDVVRRRGGLAVGINLSLSVEPARNNFPHDPDVLIIQGDVLKPPFKPGVFDGGFSIGVLQHTPAPAQGVVELTKVVKSGGWAAVCVYANYGYYTFKSVARYRRLHQKIKRYFGYFPLLVYSYLVAYIVSPLFRMLLRTRWQARVYKLKVYLMENWLPFADQPDPRWTALDTFDSLSPSIVSHHSLEEIISWLEAAGCDQVYDSNWYRGAAYGLKR